MRFRNAVLALLAATLLPLLAHAQPVSYSGTLVSGSPATGSAAGFSWFLDQGAGISFWQFSANAGDTVTLSVNRLNGNFDPGLSLYRGTTTADVAAFMTPGPNGDPFGSFAITTSGLYTVAVGGSLSTDAGSYPFRITMTDVAAVPEPETTALLALGLGVLAMRRRRRAG